MNGGSPAWSRSGARNKMLMESPKLRVFDLVIPAAWRTLLRVPSAPTTYLARIV
jgi:hypothetical protein